MNPERTTITGAHFTLSHEDMQTLVHSSTAELSARFGNLHLTANLDVQNALVLALLSNPTLIRQIDVAAAIVSAASELEDAAA